jgi:putative ABC transport system permease protein
MFYLLRWLLPGIVVAVPFAWWGLQSWLGRFAVQIEQGVPLYFVPLVTLLGTAALLVLANTLRVAAVSPVRHLRDT